MTDRYAKLRAALDHLENLNHTGVISLWVSQAPAVRALLADYDRMREAARQMHVLYPYVWDRTDGCLVVFPENIERFDAAFEALGAALAQEQGDSDAT